MEIQSHKINISTLKIFMLERKKAQWEIWLMKKACNEYSCKVENQSMKIVLWLVK